MHDPLPTRVHAPLCELFSPLLKSHTWRKNPSLEGKVSFLFVSFALVRLLTCFGLQGGIKTPVPLFLFFRTSPTYAVPCNAINRLFFTTPSAIQSPFGVDQELLKDSIQVLRQKCDSMIAEVEAFESGVDFDEAMP